MPVLPPLCVPPPLAAPHTVTHEDEGTPENDEGLHGIRVHQCCQSSCKSPESVGTAQSLNSSTEEPF